VALKNKYGIVWEYCSPGHHETVGAVERANHTLMQKLKKLTNNYTLKWENYLEKATRAVNISYNKAIATSPIIIKYGILPDLPVDIDLKKTNHAIYLSNKARSRQKVF